MWHRHTNCDISYYSVVGGSVLRIPCDIAALKWIEKEKKRGWKNASTFFINFNGSRLSTVLTVVLFIHTISKNHINRLRNKTCFHHSGCICVFWIDCVTHNIVWYGKKQKKRRENKNECSTISKSTSSLVAAYGVYKAFGSSIAEMSLFLPMILFYCVVRGA